MTNFRKIRLFIASMLCFFALAVHQNTYAIPADQTERVITQPDGSTLTIKLVGDEFLHYTVTSDGYTVQKNAAGYYVYVTPLKTGELGHSTVIAHDAAQRSSEEKSFLAKTQKYLVSESSTKRAGILSLQQKSVFKTPLFPLQASSSYDFSKFRGLVILVEFNDCSFLTPNVKSLFSDILNKKDYTGYTDQNGTFQSYTGSVRDYFYDNSLGKFSPEFDVVGPVKIDVSCTFPRGMTNARSLSQKVMDAADPIVDFSKYDRDGDGVVDMVYFICAGYGAAYAGNNSDYLWAHAWSLYGDVHDGVKLDRYACSNEMYGWEGGESSLDGIGTICHEFSHVLGLKDEYDTDYANGGGQSFHPDNWSLMAGGNHINMSRTPVGYSLFQRYQAGFSVPKLISASGSYSIPSLAASGTGYRINSSVDKEYFLFENRQKSKWDAYLPATGMLVTRIDSTDTSVWVNNKINCDPSHNYIELVRAIPATKLGAFATDVYPQPTVTSLTNETTPNICSWTGRKTPFVLSDIKKVGSIVRITVAEDKAVTGIESLSGFGETDGSTKIYDINGRVSGGNNGGINIVVKTQPDGKQVVKKMLNLYR